MENQTTTEKKNTATTKLIYTGKTHTTGGRDGGASISSDGKLDVKLSTPGAAGRGTNPEQLFAAGWSACFIGAMKKAASDLKIHLPSDTSVDTEVDLLLDSGGYRLSARLHVTLPGIDSKTASIIATNAHGICPYSKATRGNIDVAIHVK